MDAKNEYITTDISLRKLCEKHGLSFSNVSKKSMTEKWGEQKKKFRKKVESRTQENVLKRVSRKKAARLDKIINCSTKLDEMLDDILEDKKMLKNAKAVRDITAALKDSIEIKKALFGIMNEYDKQRINLDKAKLEFEKEKYKHEIENEGKAADIRIEYVGQTDKLSDWSG